VIKLEARRPKANNKNLYFPAIKHSIRATSKLDCETQNGTKVTRSLATEGQCTATAVLLTVISYYTINILRTGLLNCLNARSRGLIQSEVRFL
jgi:hypothetical protein